MKTIKLKLTHDQLIGMHELVSYLLNEWPGEDKAEKLLDVLVHKIRIKLRNRLDNRNKNAGYQITLTEEEALAFEIWYGQVVALPESTFRYEQINAQAVCFQIDKHYA